MGKSSQKPPRSFKPLLWSYDFAKLDLNNDKKVIITNVINYGNLAQWKWIRDFYGLANLRKTLMSITTTELRDRVRPLVQLVFSIPNFKDASRSTKRKR